MSEDFGTREDGTPKGLGYFGKIARTDDPASFSSELSASSEVNGKKLFYPLIVPTLSREQIDHLVSGGEPTEAIYDKAIDHALYRQRAGKSPFAEEGEQGPLPETLATTVKAVKDPAIRERIKALPPEDAHGIQEEILGKVITHPDFQTLLKAEPDEALKTLHEFGKTLPIPIGAKKAGVPNAVEDAFQAIEKAPGVQAALDELKDLLANDREAGDYFLGFLNRLTGGTKEKVTPEDIGNRTLEHLQPILGANGAAAAATVMDFMASTLTPLNVLGVMLGPVVKGAKALKGREVPVELDVPEVKVTASKPTAEELAKAKPQEKGPVDTSAFGPEPAPTVQSDKATIEATKARLFQEYPEVKRLQDIAAKEGGGKAPISKNRVDPTKPDSPWTPEAEADNRRIADQVLSKKAEAQAKAGEKPKLVFVMGMPGSGKSEVLVKQLEKERKFVTIDNDEAKRAIPGFDPERPWLAHDQASHIMENIVLPEAVDGTTNVLVDGVGANAKKALAIAKKAKAKGYEIEVHHISTDVTQNLESAAKRSIKGLGTKEQGRNVPFGYIEGLAGSPENTYNELRRSGYADRGSSRIKPGQRAPGEDAYGAFKERDSFGEYPEGHGLSPRERRGDNGRAPSGPGQAPGQGLNDKPPPAPPSPPTDEGRQIPLWKDPFRDQLTVEHLTDVKNSVIGEANKLDPKQRVSQALVAALKDGTIDPSSIAAVVERTGLSHRELVEQLLPDVRASAQTMNVYSQLRKQMDRMAKTNPDAAAALDVMNKSGPAITWYQRIKDAYTSVDNIRRGLMVAQIGTTARNIISQTARYATEVLDTAMTDVLRQLPQFRKAGEAAPEPFARSAQLITSFFHALKPSSQARVMAILDSHPVEQGKLLGHVAGELSLGSGLTRTVNILNSTQERFFQRALFDASLRGQIREAGMDVRLTLADPASIPEAMIQRATQTALEGTFAAPAKPGTLAKAISTTYANIPFLTTINPYPKFWGNSMAFLAEHNPAGLLSLANTKNPKERAEIYAKAITGTTLLAGAIAARATTARGDRPFELKGPVDPKTGKAEVVDTRGYAPFSTYLFFADVLDTVASMGHDVIKDGRTLKQAMIDRYHYSQQDFLQGIIGMNRIAGTGLTAIDLARSPNMDATSDLIRDFAAQYLSGFTVPVRSIKDFVAGVSDEENKMRDTRKTLLGPTMNNFPGISRYLPEAGAPLQAEQPPRTEHPVMRQFGLTLSTRNAVEQEVGRLGIEYKNLTAKTGVPEADREIHKIMGPKVEEAVGAFVRDPAYRRIGETKGPEMQRLVLSAAIEVFRKQARDEMVATHPDLAAKVKVKTVPHEIKDLLVSLGLPDLSRLFDKK